MEVEEKENISDIEENIEKDEEFVLDDEAVDEEVEATNNVEEEISKSEDESKENEDSEEESNEREIEFDEKGLKEHFKRLRQQQDEDEQDEFGEEDKKESEMKEAAILKKNILKKEAVFEKKVKQHVYNLVKGIGVNLSDKKIKYQKNENYKENLIDLKKILLTNTDGRARIYVQQLHIVKQDLIPLLATSKENTEICEIVGKRFYAKLLVELLVLLTNPPCQEEIDHELVLKLKIAQQYSKDAFTMKDVIAILSIIVSNQIYPEKNLEFIENVLKLVVNLLKIETKNHDGYMNEKLLIQMKKEKFLDILIFLIQETGSKFMRLYMQILNILIVNQSGLDLATTFEAKGEKLKPNQDAKNKLLETIKLEKEKKGKNPMPLRHSRFGGPLVQKLTETSKVLLNSRTGSEMLKKNTPIQKSEKFKQDTLESITSNEVKVILKHFIESFKNSCFNDFMRAAFDHITNSDLDFNFEYDFLSVTHLVFEFNRAKKDEYDVSYISELFGEELMEFIFSRVDYKQETGYVFFKKMNLLEKGVGILKEIFIGIEKMSTSNDSTIKENSLSLLYKALYDQKNFSNIPKLIAKYKPNLLSKRYIFDLFELAHTLIKLIKSNEVYVKRKKKDDDTQFSDKQFLQCFTKKSIVSNYMKILALYETNSKRMNHMIIKLLSMVAFECKMEPRFFQLSNLNIFSNILNDSSMRDNKDFKDIISFSKSIVKSFIEEAKKNPNLFCEILFVKSKEDIFHFQKERDVEENILREELHGENEFEFTSEAFDETLVSEKKSRRRKKEKKSKRKRREEDEQEKEEDKETSNQDQEDQEQEGEDNDEKHQEKEVEKEEEEYSFSEKKNDQDDEQEYTFEKSVEYDKPERAKKNKKKKMESERMREEEEEQKEKEKQIDSDEEHPQEEKSLNESPKEKKEEAPKNESEDEYSFSSTSVKSTPIKSRKNRREKNGKKEEGISEKSEKDHTPNKTPVRSRKKKKTE